MGHVIKDRGKEKGMEARIIKKVNGRGVTPPEKLKNPASLQICESWALAEGWQLAWKTIQRSECLLDPSKHKIRGSHSTTLVLM